MTDLATAHADAWAVLAGRPGGAVARLPGVRLASSGTGFGQYNGADLVDPLLADPAAVAAWFAGRGEPWAWRVPERFGWAGQLLVEQPLMGLPAAGFRPAPWPDGFAVRPAAPADLEACVAVDVAAFGGPAHVARTWLGGHLEVPGVEVALVTGAAGPVALAYAVRSDADAGPAVMLAGVGVVPSARRRGVAAGVSSWLLARAFAAGSAFAHLQPDDDRAARVYARLGFATGPGVRIQRPD
ncbi:GNAT family N-acetyltransferase [Kineococcus sp. SYSU DK003]|uniref:GNAT family N-acetyltransferase n=1 Tax=Kineococcus sp. SYSU DK003 TaxID=3383124 RepID=UPI003D7D8B44